MCCVVMMVVVVGALLSSWHGQSLLISREEDEFCVLYFCCTDPLPGLMHFKKAVCIDINFGRRFCGVVSGLAAAKIYSIELMFSIKTRSCCYDEMPPVMIYGVYYFASDSFIERRM